MKRIFTHLLNKAQKRFGWGKVNERLERGQVLVIVTLSVIVLTAIVGLAVDTGLLYLNHGKLRRAVDAAALAATSQFREGYDEDQMSAAAMEFLVLNGVNDPVATVQTSIPCEVNPSYDPDLCTEPPRKLVRVRASSVVDLAFLSVIGIHQTTVSASAISEAASMDVVFVIDTSESMAFDAPADPADPDHYLRDPSQCNPAHKCQPFEKVKAAAEAFVGELYMPYDRVSIVTFDSGARVNFSFAQFDATPDANKRAAVVSAIKNLGLVNPDVCDTTDGPCRLYERDPITGVPADMNFDGRIDYLGFDCPVYHLTGNPQTCGTTSIGSGLRAAGSEFSNDATFRQEALWVVILLTDGAANGPFDNCPNSTWIQPFCRDIQLSRHCQPGDTACIAKGGIVDEDNFDTDDYAHMMADFLAEQQDVLIFSIGLGDLVKISIPRARISDPTQRCSETPPDPVNDCYGAGELMMQYAADIGRGNYYFAPTGAELEAIFLDIAQNLATRLTQ
jgi:Flp pilus assembly protein TadG